jgi:hypothetical protein
MNTSPDELVVHGPHFAERVRRNQQRLGSELKAHRRALDFRDRYLAAVERGYARWSYVIVHTALSPG